MLVKIYDIAFNKNVQNIGSHSFNKEIDVKFSIQDEKLAINLSPSNSKIDWTINFDCLPRKYGKTFVHRGYLNQWKRHREVFLNIISSSPTMLKALQKGLVIVGRSKGGGEASLIALDILENFAVGDITLAMLDAPNIGNKKFIQLVEEKIKTIYRVRYGADIITMNPPWFKSPGKLIWFNKKKYWSFKDHEIGCFNQPLMYTYAKEYDNGHIY